jgi:hypothetical protein
MRRRHWAIGDARTPQGAALFFASRNKVHTVKHDGAALMRQAQGKAHGGKSRVDLPAPDSPMRPRTSPLQVVNALDDGVPEIIAEPSILRPLMSRRVSPMTRFLSVTIAKPTCFMEEPINYEIYGNGEKCYRRGRIERCRPAEADQRLAFSHH